MRSTIFALSLVVLPAVATAQPQAASSADAPVVVTVGEGSVKRTPDRAWVTVGAESRARTPQEAQRLNADAMSSVLQKLKGIGLPADAIRTTGYDLQPEFDYANNRQTLRGYVARNSAEVRVDDFQKVGEVLNVAVTAGATNVSGVRFDLKDRSAAEREALRLAVGDGRAKAEAAAAGAGVKVERIVRIEEQRVGVPQPRIAMLREAAQAGAEPPVSAGEIEIRAMVTVTAAIK